MQPLPCHWDCDHLCSLGHVIGIVIIYAASAMSLGLWSFMQPRPCHWDCDHSCSLGHVIGNVLENWQLAVLPQSGGTEFDPRWVPNNLSVPLRVYVCFPMPEHQNQTHKYVCTGVYAKFSDKLSEEPFPWLIQKFPYILIFKTGQPGCQLNLSFGQIRLDLTSGRPSV